MNALSMVGAKQEECGQHFKDILKMLEDSPILKPIMPWGQYMFNIIRGLIYLALFIFRMRSVHGSGLIFVYCRRVVYLREQSEADGF